MCDGKINKKWTFSLKSRIRRLLVNLAMLSKKSIVQDAVSIIILVSVVVKESGSDSLFSTIAPNNYKGASPQASNYNKLN